MKKNHFLFFLFLLVLFAPYLMVFEEWTGLHFRRGMLVSIYGFSILQAGASLVLTMVLAVPGAMGLFWLRHRVPAKWAAAFEFVILLPSLLPSLFVLVSFLNLIPFFPFGLPGVVILHAFSEVGLVALILHRLLEHKLSPYIDDAELMGCSRRRLLKTSMPLIAPQLTQVAYVLFLFFLSSVSIPLILAGGEYVSFEAVIYQKIYVAHDWSQAGSLFLIQTLFIGALVTSISRIPSTKTENVMGTRSDYLGLSTGLLCVIFPVAVIGLSLLVKIPMGLVGLAHQTQILVDWHRYLTGSLLIGFVSGGVSFIGLSFLTYFYLEPGLRKYFAWVMTPSSVMLAFAFFLLPGESPAILYFKIAIALAFSFLPALKRFGFLQKMETLVEQAEVAEFLGAGRWKVFSRGVWPQALPQISLLSGLGAVWAMGDFAVSRIIAGSDMTLAMWTQSLVDQYRWDMALVLSWLVLGASFLVFGFFWSLSYVSHKALSENL